MTQLTINIENPSVLPVLKKLLGLIDGVSIAKPIRKTTTSKTKIKGGLDEAMEDVRAKRVNTYNSAEEMFDKLGI